MRGVSNGYDVDSRGNGWKASRSRDLGGGLAAWLPVCAVPESREVMRVFLSCVLGMAVAAQADVHVFVQESHGLALINYQCTAGEVVQAFALDVVVDRGVIEGVSQFFRGESRAGSRGYGIFPASFREHLAATAGTNVDWASSDYLPLAAPGDSPADTLPGLGSSGVTLELAALWDPSVPEAIPSPVGTLCALHLSEAAQVSVAANVSRGGVVGTSADFPLRTTFAGASVDPAILIRQVAVNGEALTIEFQGGELEYATSLEGPWVPTGNSSGLFQESTRTNLARFYRVRGP